MSNTGTHNIRLKLLPENNVILAKCDGLETEVFMPALIDGRICIINVIPQRRCRCVTTVHLVAKKTQIGQTEESPSNTLSQWRVPISTGKKKINNENKSNSRKPLANSTPAQSNIPQAYNMREMTIAQDLSSPQQMRNAFFIDNTQLIEPNWRKTEELIFKNLENIEPPQGLSLLPDKRDDFSLEQAEVLECKLTDVDILRASTPPNILENCNFNNTLEVSKMLSASGTGWRKVLTPVRTYAREKYPLNTSQNFQNVQNDRLFMLPSQTAVPSCSHSVVIKKRKLMIDNKTIISPKSLKKQMTTEETELLKIQPNIRHSRNNLRKKCAFDLLTAPSRNPNHLSKYLFDQFRRRCVNKGSTTYPKYKLLCAVSPNQKKKKSNAVRSEAKGGPQESQFAYNAEQIQASGQPVSSQDILLSQSQTSTPRPTISKKSPRNIFMPLPM